MDLNQHTLIVSKLRITVVKEQRVDGNWQVIFIIRLCIQDILV